MVLFQLCIVASYGSMGKYLQSLYSRSGFNARASDARNISRSPSSDEEQLSVSSRLKERVARIVGRSDPALAAIFRRCYDTLPRLITVEKRSGLQPYAFVSTGDIPDMWLRDSAQQVLPYLRHGRAAGVASRRDRRGARSTHRPTLELAAALVRMHVLCLSASPYANNCRSSWKGDSGRTWEDISFGRGGWTPATQFELDSVGAFLELSSEVWSKTSADADNERANRDLRDSTFDDRWRRVVRRLLALLRVEQDHEQLSMHEYPGFRGVSASYPELAREGRGTRVRSGTGLIWSGFTPGDDSPSLGYVVPSNMMIVAQLERLRSMLNEGLELRGGEPRGVWVRRVAMLHQTVARGLREHATVPTRRFGRVWAYMVDGFGNYVLMDDANAPSLLSAPLVGYAAADDPLYQATRRLALTPSTLEDQSRCRAGFDRRLGPAVVNASEAYETTGNPCFFVDVGDHKTMPALRGIGSLHTGTDKLWPMSLIVQARTVDRPLSRGGRSEARPPASARPAACCPD